VAVITTAIDATLQRFAFQGLDEVTRPLSHVPRAEMFWQVLNAVVPPPGESNNQRVIINCSLPGNFAYVVSEVHLRTTQTMGGSQQNDGVDAVVAAVLMDTISLGESTLAIPFSGTSLFPAEQNGRRGFTFDLPKTLIAPYPYRTQASVQNTGLLQFDFFSNFENGGEISVNLFCRVLQFDIDQLHHFQVNTPTPVR